MPVMLFSMKGIEYSGLHSPGLDSALILRPFTEYECKENNQ